MNKLDSIDQVFEFKNGLIISSTDLQGTITYVNRKFCEVSNYSKNELINTNHNIIRHPEMPKTIFQDLWKTIGYQQEWTGVIKNLRKDGLYFWVFAHISPTIEDDKIVGYTAAGRPASKSEIEESASTYKELLTKEQKEENV